MKKKGRGRAARVRVAKKSSREKPYCPFWLFALLITAWVIIFSLMVGLFYTVLRYPTKRLIPTGSSSTSQTVVPQPAVSTTVPVVEAPKLSVVSCTQLIPQSTIATAINRWLDSATPTGTKKLRELGQLCELSDKRSLVTFTYNEQVPSSERLFLQQSVGMFADGKLAVDSFYCRTASRGNPASIDTTQPGLQLSCSFAEGDATNQISIVLNDDGTINDRATLAASNNSIAYRIGTGDTARDFCIEIRNEGSVPNGLEDIIDPRGLDDSPNVCRLRNGVWAFAIPGGSLVIAYPDGHRVKSAFSLGGQDIRIIGSEGSALDVLQENRITTKDCFSVAIDRMDTRNGSVEPLLNKTSCQ